MKPPLTPALAFGDEADAVDALHEYAELRAFLDAIQAPLLLGALAAGVQRAEIHRITGHSFPHLRKLVNEGDEQDVAVTFPPAVEYASVLRDRATRVFQLGDRTARGASNVYHQAANLLENPQNLRLRIHWSEDSDLALLAIELHDAAATYEADAASTDPDRRAFGAGAAPAARRVVAEIALIRRHGEDGFAMFEDADEARTAIEAANAAAKAAIEAAAHAEHEESTP